MDWIERAREGLTGRVVVVTGASSGIGRAFALAMAPSGATFVLLARREPLLAELAEEITRLGSRATVQSVDLRDPDAARAAAEETLADMGTPDVLLANAGHSIARGILATADRPDSITRSVASNFTGPVAHALPLLRAMAERGSGHLIGTSTATARLSVPGWGPYAGSKAAWDAWLRSVAPELRRLGVATSILAYPLVATPMTVPTRGERPRFALSPERAAAWAARAVVTRQARVAPAWLRPVEVLHAVAPTTLARLFAPFSARYGPR